MMESYYGERLLATSTPLSKWEPNQLVTYFYWEILDTIVG